MTFTELVSSPMQSLTVPGDLESLDDIAQLVMAAANTAGLDKKAAYRLRLAVDEIATNIILHGYEEAGLSGVLDLQVELDEKTLTLTIEDSAIPYNPTEHLIPQEEELQKSLGERKIGGLGVYLAIQGVDQFKYDRVHDRNQNIFVVNRPLQSL